jgi:hypothetical protein
MLDPNPADIRWWEMCETLAHINRYTGCAEPDVSVAFHSLIVHDVADESVKPYALIHDFHEAIIGDISTPTAQAIGAVANEYTSQSSDLPDDLGERIVKWSIRYLKRRHDLAIWAAAGLTPPTPEQQALIRHADIVALNTEVRDFMAPKPDRWGDEYEAVPPAKQVYTKSSFGSTQHAVAQELYERVKAEIPFWNGVYLPLREAA